MSEINERIDELQVRLDKLVRTQIDFQTEISQIRYELSVLRAVEEKQAAQSEVPPTPPVHKQPVAEKYEPKQPPPRQTSQTVDPPNLGYSWPSMSANKDDSDKAKIRRSSDLEKFIGENLISKIGIVVLIIGVGIGAKYAIDKGWITPLMRIIFGYAVGVLLIGFAVRLKPKYHNFSAVLLSGGMAVMYFITYFAYSLYGLMGQASAFALMFVFTIFSVVAAINYSRQVIAHIGLVGAYAIPFLLSDDSGNYAFLFSYMAIINTGILAISVKSSWKPLFYTSSAFTWLIFFGWFVNKYSPGDHFYLALIFLAVFFAIFYATKIIHVHLHSETDSPEDLISTVITTLIFYGLCFGISDVQVSISAYAMLFTYLAVISLAILITSYRFYSRALIAVSCPLTWLIFGSWFVQHYEADQHFYLAGTFAVIFFLVYYGATLIYRLVSDEIGLAEHAALLLSNSFVFYGLSYGILHSRENLKEYVGLLTVGHGIFHCFVAYVVSRLKPAAVDVIQALTILIITFATIAIPVQFDGNYVTLIWSVEGALLFYYGRAKTLRVFEYLSYPVMLLAMGSLFLDWVAVYSDRTMYVSELNRQPLANGEFVTALVFVAAFAFIYIVNRDEEYEAAIDYELISPFGYAIAVVASIALYNAFRIEISNYFHLRIVALSVKDAIAEYAGPASASSNDLGRFNVIWQINYTMFFLAAMALLNLRKVRSEILSYVNVGLIVFCLGIFSTVAMYLFYELRVSYLSPGYDNGLMNVVVRYISYVFVAVLLYLTFKYGRDELLNREMSAKQLELGFNALFYTILLVIVSCELVNLMAQLQIPDSTKLGLSVLWGIYALVLIVIGIAKGKKHLRIATIVLLAFTLVKLFFYDIADLPTIQKTILFVSLGLLMLIVSFLYNKYKNVIFASAAENEE
jgi:uncharacterized membrane protein